MGKAGEREATEERKGKAALDALEARATTAERLLARIGHRAFQRPRVAVSARIFAKYRVADPWDPDPREPEDPIALGPVAIKLGDRRRVAQHLAPPEPAKKKEKAAVDPVARFRPKPGQESPPKPRAEAAPRPDAAPRPEFTPRAPARPAPPPPQAPSEVAREFGARDARQPLRKPLPMRPDRAPVGEAIAAPAAAAPAELSRSVPRAPPPPSGPGAAQGGSTGGRYRMKPTATSAPVVREVRRLDEVTAEEAAAPPPPPEPPAPRPPMPPMSDGLDDLFGMAAMGGRMTLGRRKKDDEPG